MHHNSRCKAAFVLPLMASVAFLTLPAVAQTVPNTGATVNQAGQTVNRTVGQAGQTVNSTVGTVGQTAQGVVGGLQPTLQPVGEGVGGALNNLTQPDTVRSLLEFLSSVVPNHIEAHVNLDALRVEKLTVDVRGVDLRNLKVDLLVANSRGGGKVEPVLNQNSAVANTANTSTAAPNTSATTGTTGTTTNQ